MRRFFAKWFKTEPPPLAPEQIELRQTTEELKIIARSLASTQRRMAAQIQRLLEEESRL